MKQILAKAALMALVLAAPGTASAQAPLRGEWRNAKGSVVVRVEPCGNSYCGVVAWASAHNREKGARPGTRVLSDLRPAGNGVYKGEAYEPKRNLRGAATVRHVAPDVMMVKGCVIGGILCKEQRWTRVS